ncbi:hypothetical protein ABZ419_02650 [Streptomyces cinnamoneus]|uniref:hypothetical protein n=1 Tax=Streptomyces cinnamoneus TaxID=53446 RepID=UPI00340E8189
MSGLHAREDQDSKIDVTHPLRASVILLIGALIPPAAVVATGHDAHSAPARPAPVAVPDRSLAEEG